MVGLQTKHLFILSSHSGSSHTHDLYVHSLEQAWPDIMGKIMMSIRKSLAD